MRLAVKRQIATLWSGLRRINRSDRALVALYHSLGTSPVHISKEQFREQIAWLAANTKVVHIDAIASKDWPESPTGLVSAITFDDGYVGVHDIAMPILREFDCPAIVYVSTDTIDTSKNRQSSNDLLMNWPQLGELSQNGISIGSHLMSHEDITRLPQSEARSQLQGSKAKIEEMIGKECTSLAYPWGKYSESAVELVRGAGYRSAVIATHRTITRTEVDPLRIPRADIQKIYTLDDFKSIVRGDWDYLGYYQRFRSNRKY